MSLTVSDQIQKYQKLPDASIILLYINLLPPTLFLPCNIYHHLEKSFYFMDMVDFGFALSSSNYISKRKGTPL